MVHYNRAIELDEENIDAYVCKGSIFEQLQKYDRAKEVYEAALQVQRDNPKVLEALAKLAKNFNTK